MENNKNLIKVNIYFRSCCLKINLNKIKSSSLRCDDFVNMVLKKFQNLNQKAKLSPIENYGLFESCNGIDMLIPDSKLILQMEKLITNQSHFFIREKNYFELNQNNELTDSVRSKILSYYRKAKKNSQKKSLRLAKSQKSIKNIQSQLKLRNYIKKTQIIELKIAENVQYKWFEASNKEETSSKIFIIKKITKLECF